MSFHHTHDPNGERAANNKERQIPSQDCTCTFNAPKLHQHSEHGCDGRHENRFYPDPTSSLSPKNGHFRRLLTAYTTGTCGRATYKLTWKEIVALYRLTERQPAANTRHQIRR